MSSTAMKRTLSGRAGGAADGVAASPHAATADIRNRVKMRINRPRSRRRVRRYRDGAEVGESGVDRHEIDGAGTDVVGSRHPGRDPDQRRARRLFPERELTPVLLLAQVPAVVAPEDDDRVLPVGALVQPIDQAPD